MEVWQKEHINKNLTDLTELTTFNASVTAELQARKILSNADVKKLDAVQKQNGDLEASRLYYQILPSRIGAYRALYEALYNASQSGAYTILVRVPTERFNKPLTYLGIPTELKNFQDVVIEVQGKRFKLNEFFPGVDYEKLQQIFRNCLTELEIYEIFCTTGRKFILASSSVPPKRSYYVPRFLSNRVSIDESVFKSKCKDVFVFKNTIKRPKLSQMASPNSTFTSSSQLKCITCRFIYLEYDEDWSKLKMSANAPIHLINYEADQDIYLVEDSSAPSDILRKQGSTEQRVYMSENEFVEQQLSENCTSSSVCICDTPGMGKTYLLENIARLMTDYCTRRIVVFIQLASFANKFFQGSPMSDLKPETPLINVLSYVFSPRQNQSLLLSLVKAEILRLDIFFDGFDEISTENVEWTKQIFRLITTSFPTVRIYITSRPHMRQELEQSFGVVAYDILPFKRKNQVDFLVQFWQSRKLDLDHLSLQGYATSCINSVNESLTRNDKEIAGIPLLCLLIAEVYSDKDAFRSIKAGRLSDVPLQISEMYEIFITKKIKLVSRDKNEFKHIKNVHIWHALKLLFPTNGFYDDKQFKTVNDLPTTSKMLTSGILQKHSNEALEFIHRTFAEFLVANYFFDKLMKTQKGEESNCDSMSIYKLLLCCQKSEDKNGNKHSLLLYPLDCQQQRPTKENYDFVHPGTVSFFNYACFKYEISEKLKMQGAEFISSISHEELFGILCECCKHNLVNLFRLLTEPSKTWEKSRILECFTNEKSYELLKVCIKESSSQLFQKCVQLLVGGLDLDLELINTFEKYNTLLQIAVRCVNYEAVEYFVEKVSLKTQSLLRECVSYSYGMENIEERVDILHLLHYKDPTLIHETPNILMIRSIDLRLFKILVEIGANLTAACETYGNCVMSPAGYMSPSDFHELVQFLFTDRKAEYLFLANEKWKDPLPVIIARATLLSETLDMLLSIPGNNINMKDKDGENLLFTAAKGNSLDNLRQLVYRGLDYNTRGRWNRSLLHWAAMRWGGVEMILYLLSLKLDPNSHDENKWTPLHHAAFSNMLSKVKVLVEHGANIQAKNNDGRTALHISAKVSHDKEIIKYLIKNGLGVNDRDKYGNAPLNLCRNKEAIECLVEMGADIHAKNKNGQSVFHIYAKNKYPEKKFMENLIRMGVLVNDRDHKGNTPIHLCWKREVIDCLVELGANIHAKNKKGQTPAQMNPDLWK